MQEIDEAVIDWWRILLEDQSADTEWMERHDVRDRHRVQVRREILDPQAGWPVLNRFLSGSIGSKELRATFDKKARNEWNVFGFRGLSGAMFLSKLVKHRQAGWPVPDEQALAANLRRVLPAPTDEREGLRTHDLLHAVFAGPDQVRRDHEATHPTGTRAVSRQRLVAHARNGAVAA